MWLIAVCGACQAHAAPFVVGEGDALKDREAVADQLGVELADVGVVRPSEVRARQPWAKGAVLQTCQGAPARRDEVATLVETARTLLLRDANPDGALDALQQAKARLVCAADVPGGELLFDLFFVRGYLEAVREDEISATRAFRTARNLAPERGWDTRYPPDGEDLFDAASDGDSVRIEFSPVPTALHVDGVRQRLAPRTTLDLSSGQHLLQFGSEPPLHSTMLFDPERLPTLVVPGLLPTLATDWVAPELSPDLGTILERVLPSDAELWIVTDEAFTHAPVAELSWQTTERALPPALEVPTEPVSHRRQATWARWVALGATVGAGAGLVSAGVTKVQADSLYDEALLDADLAEQYGRVRGAHLASWTVAGTSGGLALGALYLDVVLGSRGAR